MLTDQQHETMMDMAREREADAAAPGLSYAHGLKVGRAIEIAIASLEGDLIALSPMEKLALAEGITEACWDALEDDLNGAAIDFDEAERGVCAGSHRYAEARALHDWGQS